MGVFILLAEKEGLLGGSAALFCLRRSEAPTSCRFPRYPRQCEPYGFSPLSFSL